MTDYWALSAKCQGPDFLLPLASQTPKAQYNTVSRVGGTEIGFCSCSEKPRRAVV